VGDAGGGPTGDRSGDTGGGATYGGQLEVVGLARQGVVLPTRFVESALAFHASAATLLVPPAVSSLAPPVRGSGQKINRSHAHAHGSRTNHSHEHRASNGATTLNSQSDHEHAHPPATSPSGTPRRVLSSIRRQTPDDLDSPSQPMMIDDDCLPPRDTSPHHDSTGTAPSGTPPPAQPPHHHRHGEHSPTARQAHSNSLCSPRRRAQAQGQRLGNRVKISTGHTHTHRHRTTPPTPTHTRIRQEEHPKRTPPSVKTKTRHTSA